MLGFRVLSRIRQKRQQDDVPVEDRAGIFGFLRPVHETALTTLSNLPLRLHHPV